MELWELKKEDVNWRPYCLACTTIYRMEKTDYGYRCKCCGNQTHRDLTARKSSNGS